MSMSHLGLQLLNSTRVWKRFGTTACIWPTTA